MKTNEIRNFSLKLTKYAKYDFFSGFINSCLYGMDCLVCYKSRSYRIVYNSYNFLALVMPHKLFSKCSFMSEEITTERLFRTNSLIKLFEWTSSSEAIE